MGYVTESGYPTVGDYAMDEGMHTVGGWPSYQPGAGWSQRTYTKTGMLHGLAGLLGDLAAAALPPPPSIITAEGKVLGVTKKPTPAKGMTPAKPGKLAPASGTMRVIDAQGRLWTCTVSRGTVTAAKPTQPGEPPAPTVVRAQPVPLPAGPTVRPPAPTIIGSPIAPTGIATPLAPTIAAGGTAQPPAPTMVPAQSYGPPAPTMVPAQSYGPPAPTVVPAGARGCPPCRCGGQPVRVPVQQKPGQALPARGIFGGRLPTATQFAGRPAGVSATTSVAAVPVAPTREGTVQRMPAAWSTIQRAPTVAPTFKPRRMDPAFMAQTSL